MAKSCSEQVSAVRRAVYEAEGSNLAPKYVAKTKRLEAELAEARAALSSAESPRTKELQNAIDRMWHVMNERGMRDDDKLDIVYGELAKLRTR